MAKGKKGKKGRRNDDWSDEEEDSKPAAPKEDETPQLSRKQKRLQKQQQKSAKQDDKDDDGDDIMALIKGGGGGGDSDDEEEEEDDYAAEIPKRGSQKKRGSKQVAAKEESDEDDDEMDDDSEALLPTSSSGKRGKQRGNQRGGGSQRGSSSAFAFDDDSDEEDEDSEEEEDSDVEQIAFTILDDGGKGDKGDKEKKKKKKEDKKKRKEEKKEKKREKKEKKKEKKEKHKHDDEDDVADLTETMDNLQVDDAPAPAPSTPGKPADPNKPKSKFELQMEAAIRKKEEEESEAVNKTEEEARKKVEEEKRLAEELKLEQQAEAKAMKEADEIRKKMEAEEAGGEVLEEYYGHGDEAWTDKSSAQRDAENNPKGPDTSLTHDADGKKLSVRERKKLQKAREAEARMAEYEKVAAKASHEGAQFACSQTTVSKGDQQWENALDIIIPNFSISAAGKVLFKDAALSIAKGRRYGLVGPNGKGKSTLLKMIASGDLNIPPRIDFLYVEQEVVADETPAVEAVLKADKKRWDLLQEEDALMKQVDDGDEDMAKIDRLQVVTEELAAMGADSAEAKARRILFGLGFDMDMQVKPTKMFSGGWRMRISLARALFVEPTLLMLDEPTNHLDLNAVIWLDDYLQRWKKTLLVVSHDQDFLNSVTQEILHIEDLKLVSYKGNYDSFKAMEATRFKQQVKAWELQEKRIREMKRSGQSKAKAVESAKSRNKREPGARSKKQQNNAIASGVEAAEQQELIKRPKEYHVKFSFAEVADIGRPVMEINQVHFRYSPKHPVIFEKVDFGIDMDSRICIVGPNGAGKSTLLKLMTGELDATTGDIRRNPRLNMGVYNQHFVDRLPMGKTPIEFLRDRFQDEDYQSVRNRLGKYGLEGHAHEVVMRDLSGGQKARVVFVELSLQEPHILLLDEPTNNLDIESIDALIDAVNEFDGGIVVVTHDQRLIENCNCNLWIVEKQKVTPWEAGFEDYKDTLLSEMEAQIEKETATRKAKLAEGARVKAEKLALLAAKLKKNSK